MDMMNEQRTGRISTVPHSVRVTSDSTPYANSERGTAYDESVACVLDDSASRIVPFEGQNMTMLQHGRLLWRVCPHCGDDLVWSNRPRNWSHEFYARCVPCNWGAWERDQQAQIVARFGSEVTQ